MRTTRFTLIACSVAVALSLEVTSAPAQTVPPIRPEQQPPAADAAAAAPKGKHADPTGATAQCKDGSYSHSQHRSRACRKHGGVDKWLDGSAK